MGRRVRLTDYWQPAPMPREQLVVFPTSLEERIPERHPVRLLDEILDRMDWTDWESDYHGRRGQPPMHPSILVKVLLYSMIRRIRTSREIEYHTGHSIDFIWLTSGRTIDHSTISGFRNKYVERVKDIYRQTLRLAVSMGVAKLSELCIDGTKIRANASRFKSYTREEVEKLIGELAGQLAEEFKTLGTNDALDDLFDDGEKADQLPDSLKNKQARLAKLEETKKLLEEMEERRRRDGIDNKKNPAQLPITDTDSRILPNKEGGYAPNYTPMAVTETENGFIVMADVLIGNVEHTCMMGMLEEIESDHQTKVETVLADGAYATGPNLQATEERGIELLSPLREEVTKAENPAYREDLTQPVADTDISGLPINSTTKRFSQNAFVYDEQNDVYYCPQGKQLRREGTVEHVVIAGVDAERKNYRCRECAGCPLAPLCRVNADSKTGRKVGRDNYQELREEQIERMQDSTNKERYKKRLHYGETPFAILKANMGLRQFLLRSHPKVRREWRLGCLAFNVKKLMKLMGEAAHSVGAPTEIAIEMR